MTAHVYHRFTSAIADGTDSTLVRPAHDWNDTHDLYLDTATRTGTTDTIAASDLATQITYSNAGGVAVSIGAPNSGAITPGTLGFFKGWFCWITNRGAGDVVITPAAGTIHGGATLTLKQNQGAVVVSDGTNYLGFGTGAPINSPTFTGTPQAPTPVTSDNSTSIATTAYVKANLASYAPLASPALTGTPSAPTVSPQSDSTTKLATTAFVQGAVAPLAPIASPTFTGSPAAPTPTTSPSDNSTKLATTAFVTSLQIPQCGRLSATSGTSLSFAPFNGNKIKINGQIYDIPSSGVALNVGSCFIDGVSGQATAGTTRYYVYAFNNSGALALDLSTTGHATSTTAGNVGTEIKSGNDTRTLVGMIYTMTGSPGNLQDGVIQRGVLNWFNRRNLYLTTGNFTGSTSSTSTWTELNVSLRIAFLNWSDEGFSGSVIGNVYNNTNNGANYSTTFLDGGSTGMSGCYAQNPNANNVNPVAMHADISASEAWHLFYPVGFVGVGTGNWALSTFGMVRG